MKLQRFLPIVITASYGLLLLAVAVPLFNRYLDPAHAPSFVIGDVAALTTTAPAVTMDYVCRDCSTPSVHGANVIETRAGGLLATWFGGSREGARDAALWGAEFSPDSHTWSAPRRIIGPAETKAALGRHIKTVGNSVLARDEHGELWLYYVSVSVGGWATAALNAMHSLDEGKTWDAPRRLITSPFFNISTLNKGAPLLYSDGTIGLPVYHEFIGKFAELLRLDSTGRILDKARITHGRHAIQPVLLPLSPQQSLSLMRGTGPAGRVLLSRSDDAGMHWSADERLALANPDSAVAGLRRSDGSLLLVFNDSDAGRNSLALALSRDEGRSWRTVYHFERSSSPQDEYSYPYLIRSRDGTMHLVYTWNRKRIRHVVFNDGWVEGGQP